jgi:hypothetical protein
VLPLAFGAALWLGCDNRTCAEGTVLLSLSFVAGAEQADTLDVSVAIDEEPAQHQTRMLRGLSDETVAVAFANGYPTGRTLTLHLTTLANGTVRAEAFDTFVAAPGCTNRTLVLAGQGFADPTLPGTAVGSTVPFVQITSAEVNQTTSSVTASFLEAQQSGDLNVVAIAWTTGGIVGGWGGWGSLPHVSSVGDSTGNTYWQAVGPTSNGDNVQSIYYAPNVKAAASNRVTVRFSNTVFSATVVVLEYSGVSHLDASATSASSGSTASSGVVTMTMAPELIVGFGQTCSEDTVAFIGGGSLFTLRMLAGHNRLLVEELFALQQGTYEATASLSRSAAWVMQGVSFK